MKNFPLAKGPRIRVRAAWTVIDRIKEKMTVNLEQRLRQTVFGHYLDLESAMCESPLLLGVARHQVPTKNPSDGICYVLGNEFLHFTPIQFCLITGFRFGQFPNTIFNESPNSFKSRFFPGKLAVKQRHLDELFESDWSEYGEDDCVRICLLMLLELGFKGTQSYETIDKKVMNLVDDLAAWNQYPWGSYLWESTYSHVYDMTRRHQEGNIGFSLPGCVWPFKMWILEMFPEFKEMAKFYKKEKIPRFLSWGPGKRITSSTVERIFESSKTNEHYRPIQSLMATSNEMQTEWYISSMQYLESIRLAKQIPSNTSSFQKQNDGGADGFECIGSSFHMGTQQPKKRTSGNHAGVNYSIDDELQSFLIEKFKSLLDENNKKLVRLIMSELRNQNGDQGSVHAFEKAEVDSFVNCNDVGISHVPMEKLQRCDSLVDEAEIADLRRLERLLKPAACMLSPFVVLNKVSRRQKRREESTERNVKMIRDWYTNELSLVSKKDSRLRRLGKTIGGEVGPEFWRSLLGDDGSGWLSDDHLYGWMIKMYESRQRTDRWTILPPYFQMTVFDCESTRKLKCYFDGSMYPVPRITEVDEVYVPLHIRNLHWFLGVFNLRDETLTIYDSRLESGTLEKGRTEVICHINFAFDIWLRINGYYADKPLKMSFPFKVVYPDKVPQQSGLLGDCGVWVCIFLERLINKQPIYQEEDTATVAYQMRQRLAILFYDSLLPENFDIVSTCKSMENDSDVQVV